MAVMWEYFVDTVESNMMSLGRIDPKELATRLNWYAGQGWELFSNYTTTYGSGGTHVQVFIYRRERTGFGTPPPQPGAGSA